jgi:hypothetical protein
MKNLTKAVLVFGLSALVFYGFFGCEQFDPLVGPHPGTLIQLQEGNTTLPGVYMALVLGPVIIVLSYILLDKVIRE